MPEEPSLKYLTSDFKNIPITQNELLQKLGKPHVDSFNFFLGSGLQMIPETLEPVEFLLGDARVSIRVQKLLLDVPKVPSSCLGRKNQNKYPTECIQGGMSYTGTLHAKFELTVNDTSSHMYDKNLGEIPIMVKSAACHLQGLSPKELVALNEHEQEWGGYFISKGLQRILRMLIMTRRNYPLGVVRNVWKGRGAGFSEFGIMLHGVRSDETSANNILHYVTDGSAKLMFILRRSLFFAPVVLIMKCLMDVSDEYIFEQMLAGHEEDSFFRGCVLNMLRSVHEVGVHSYIDARKYLGKMFAVRVNNELPQWASVLDVCDHVLKNAICVHLDTPEEKFHFLVLMVQKLVSLAQGKCAPEGADSLMMHELLMGGNLYLQVLKSRLRNWMGNFKFVATKLYEAKKFPLEPGSFDLVFQKTTPIGASVQLLISTGTLPRNLHLGVSQETGLSVVLENLNRMRYMAHFRAVHRGAFFQSQRTTEARVLLPDAWGFLCPVHTPDGTPCGLLNHLATDCEVTPSPNPEMVRNFPEVLISNGVIPLTAPRTGNEVLKKSLVVMLNGKIIGYAPENILKRLVAKLRYFKVQGERIPSTTEIVLVTPSSSKLYPGLFLFTTPARMMRPVLNLELNKVELVGTFEQVFLDICIKPEEAYSGRTTHMELSKTAFLSNLANLIPMPDCNQSPRNMYQCQMGKQTMGNPCHNWLRQADGKLYRLMTPSSPFFRPRHYDDLQMDDFAMGTNAIVAVVSYTGYDMEDAMIMNKASYERGMAAGCVFKSEFFEISEGSYFGLDPFNHDIAERLDQDGLVSPGAVLNHKDPFCSYYDAEESKFRIERYKGQEPIWILSVRRIGQIDPQSLAKVHISYIVSRNPSVGDKFASRAGQKGILSQKWPSEDLPFTESGLVPDIVFNPHGFPSRMTIAMMIEIMAGKSAALHGLVHDATPFRFNEENTAIDYFGRLLEAAGYNYYGTEKMYSGVDGREMTASIFFGIVHYQRLRHMVSDKWQVRSTGPIDVVTHQPIKGRRRGGGVRFGEMERDSLISHGASFLLLDRLFYCSDHSKQSACKKCGSLLSPYLAAGTRSDGYHRSWKCRVCVDGGEVVPLNLPYIFKYLVAQLASVNIKIKVELDA